MAQQFYKEKYLICLYDHQDLPMGVYDNPKEIAQKHSIPTNTVYASLSKVFYGHRQCLQIGNKKFNILLIELTKQEIEYYMSESNRKENEDAEKSTKQHNTPQMHAKLVRRVAYQSNLR